MIRPELEQPALGSDVPLADSMESKPAQSVLLLEDEVEYGEMLKEHLESNGYSVTIARDGVQGMKKIIERDFDAVVCDLLMPNLPGDMFYAGVERVKPKLCDRFIFITGHQDNPRVLDFLRRVRSLTLFKPFGINILVEALKVTLRSK
jgi:DNA-binding response OmpR family regulator